MSIEHDVLVELRRIIRATQLNAKELARKAGLTSSQLVLLRELKANSGLTPRQVAKSMNLSQASVTTLLDRLQARGLIARSRNPADRRSILLRLTEQGEKQLQRAPESLHDTFLKDFQKLQAWEQTAILAALQRVGQLLHAAKLSASPVLDFGDIDRAATPD